MATIDIIASFRAYTRGLLDAKSGPYASVAAANAALSTNDRQVGQQVVVVTNGTTDGNGFFIDGEFSLYVYDGGIDDIHLVPLSAGGSAYDGTEAEILALNPTDYLGQNLVASDTKQVIQALDFRGTDIWQRTSVRYDSATDSFTLPTTQNGQTLNLGQEIFIPCYNNNAVGSSALNPKLYVTVSPKAGEENIKNAVQALSTDLSQGVAYGINTTSAQVGEYFSLATYGDVNGVDTSAWLQGTILYASEDNMGELTPIKPQTAIFPIAKVLKQDAVDGKLFVNTISASADNTVIPSGFDRVHYTGDEITLATGTYFLGVRNDSGTVVTDTGAATVPDDSIVALDKQVVGSPIGFPITIPIGVYEGQIEYQVASGSRGEQRFRLEYYLAEEDGTPVDSGIAAEPVGTLGVRTALRTISEIGDAPANTTNFLHFSGYLTQNIAVGPTQRVRVVFLCEKVGTQGADQNFTVYFGNQHFSYTDSPALTRISDNIDVDTSGSSENQFLKRDSVGIWRPVFLTSADLPNVIISAQDNGNVDFDLDTFNVLNLEMDGNIDTFGLINGLESVKYIINLSKDSDGYYFDIAPDYSDTSTYLTGDLVGVAINGQPDGKLYYKANQNIPVAEPFDSAKWDLYIKLQDDVAITPSYSSNIIDQLQVTPKLKGGVMYYAITPIYNVGEK